MGVHTEEALLERFSELDLDGSGTLDVAEFISAALRDAFARSAAHLDDIFADWDGDRSGSVDKVEFRAAVRHFGFVANDKLVDQVFDSLDFSKSGELSIKDLKVRLEFEASRRSRPMQQVRSLAWREERRNAAEKVDARKMAQIDPSWSFEEKEKARRERIHYALHAQSARVMDLFRSWDTDGDGEEQPDARTLW